MGGQLRTRVQRSRAVTASGRLLDRLVPASDRWCTVLTFHRLETGRPDLYPGLAGLDAVAFAAFADELATRFVPIDVDRLVRALAGGSRLPSRAVLVTFDDAYRDFADVAWPILNARGVPVVLFVPTAYPDAPARTFWWDELYAAFAASGPADWRSVGIEAATAADAFRAIRDSIKSTPHDAAMRRVRDVVDELAPDGTGTRDVRTVLGWDDLGELADQGVALAPHSRTHPMLDQLDAPELDGEIRGSLDDMHERLGRDRVRPVFAYPSGGHDPAVRAAVRRAGLTAAFTTERGLVDVARADHHRLPRLNVGRDNSVGFVAAEAALRRMQGSVRGRARTPSDNLRSSSRAACGPPAPNSSIRPAER